jgi:hypothetical protein
VVERTRQVVFVFEQRQYSLRYIVTELTRDFSLCYLVKIRQGSQWWILTREFVEYVLTDNFARRLLIYMVNSFIPDEMYFQTVFWNSPWQQKGFYGPSTKENKFRYERFFGT